MMTATTAVIDRYLVTESSSSIYKTNLFVITLKCKYIEKCSAIHCKRFSLLIYSGLMVLILSETQVYSWTPARFHLYRSLINVPYLGICS